MPRTSRASAVSAVSDDDGEDDDTARPAAAKGEEALLAAYVKSPTPGVTLVFEATRWDFEGDDKTKTERVRKFYGAIPEVVEFRRFSGWTRRAWNWTAWRAPRRSCSSQRRAEALVEALAADVGRIAVELEKLRLCNWQAHYSRGFAAAGSPTLVRARSLRLVNALGRRDRARFARCSGFARARRGEYLPLALTFLAGQFRMALVAKEANLEGIGFQVQSHFQRAGVPMWGSRAEQVSNSLRRSFQKPQLERGLTSEIRCGSRFAQRATG